MPDIELVIKLPKDMYEWVNDVNKFHTDFGISDFINIIKNGTVLPEGHGDLIDRDYFIDKYAGCGDVYCEDTSCEECNSRVVSKFNIDSAPTVIPAER